MGCLYRMGISNWNCIDEGTGRHASATGTSACTYVPDPNQTSQEAPLAGPTLLLEVTGQVELGAIVGERQARANSTRRGRLKYRNASPSSEITAIEPPLRRRLHAPGTLRGHQELVQK